MNVGIVGSEAAKFTEETRQQAKVIIHNIICKAANIPMGGDYLPVAEAVTVVSGRCHLGGIDIWAVEVARFIGANVKEFPPKKLQWEGGYKQRNILIAQNSDEVHVIVPSALPVDYKGMRFKGCYHCDRRTNKERTPCDSLFAHVKSGACWTAWYAYEKLGKDVHWHVL